MSQAVIDCYFNNHFFECLLQSVWKGDLLLEQKLLLLTYPILCLYCSTALKTVITLSTITSNKFSLYRKCWHTSVTWCTPVHPLHLQHFLMTPWEHKSRTGSHPMWCTRDRDIKSQSNNTPKAVISSNNTDRLTRTFIIWEVDVSISDYSTVIFCKFDS